MISLKNYLRKFTIFRNLNRLLLSFQFYFNNRLLNHLPSNRLRILFLKLQGMKIGRNVIIYDGFEIRSPSKITIGNNSIIGFNSVLDGRMGIRIGENVNLSSEVMIYTLQHDYDSKNFQVKGGSVVIEDRVWLSVRTIILPNITIEEGAVVAAAAVVTKNIKKFIVVGGIPAKQIAIRNNEIDYTFKGFKDYFFV